MNYNPKRRGNLVKPSSYRKKVSQTETSDYIAHESVFPMPLNKYIAHCGICSRRAAVQFIKEGKVKVNNQIVLEPATKINKKDTVLLSGNPITIKTQLVYIVLNKPKGYICTVQDEKGRKTIFEIVQHATEQTLHSVGRLDRNTTGVILLTNDGQLTQRLSHPSYEVKKIYQVELDKSLSREHFQRILEGIQFEDGLAQVDSIAYSDVKNKRSIGVCIHSGKNRIVRRIFEYFGYEVEKLDRVMFAEITKKNVPRSKWRFLSAEEVRNLKFFGNKKNT